MKGKIHKVSMPPRPPKNTAHVRAVTNRMAKEIWIAGGSVMTRPEVGGTEGIVRFANTPSKRGALLNEVLNHLRTVPRLWQFWAVIFYYDKKTGLKQFSTAMLDPIHGKSHEIDRMVQPHLQAWIDEESNVNAASYGWVALPSEEIEVDTETEEQFIRLFESRDCYNATKRSDLWMAHSLEKLAI